MRWMGDNDGFFSRSCRARISQFADSLASSPGACEEWESVVSAGLAWRIARRGEEEVLLPPLYLRP